MKERVIDGPMCIREMVNRVECIYMGEGDWAGTALLAVGSWALQKIGGKTRGIGEVIGAVTGFVVVGNGYLCRKGACQMWELGEMWSRVKWRKNGNWIMEWGELVLLIRKRGLLIKLIRHWVFTGAAIIIIEAAMKFRIGRKMK